METITLSDALYGQVNSAVQPHGKAPFGYRDDTRGKLVTTAPEKTVAAKGPGALLGPSQPLFWIGLMLVALIVLNGLARKG